MLPKLFVALLLMFVCLFGGTNHLFAQTDGRVTVVTAVDLATAVAKANPGDTIQVIGGTFTGSLEIDKTLTLVGVDWPVIDGENEGTVVSLTAPGTALSGFVIKNSGQTLDQENSGISVEAANILIENNRFEDTLFGIYLKHGHNAIIRNNVISSKDLDLPRRGDPIRVWYSTDVLIADNIINKGRDVVLWYSERVTLRNNKISNGRYGLHFMYCDDALVEHNTLIDNSVGTFLMYSRRVTLRNNTIARNRGPSGFGIGLKDMDDAVIAQNLLLDNRIGANLDTSPREVDSIGQFTGNVFAYNDIGVQMMPSVRHNEFRANSFVENEQQVAVAGGGILRENKWTINGQGNYWSDYAGFDADGDGQGDLVYKSERLFENLMQQEPELRLFIYSPASNAIDFAARAFPMVKPQPKLVDERPLMSPIIPQDAPALPQADNQGWLWFALSLIVVALGLAALPRIHRRHYRFPNNSASPLSFRTGSAE